MSLEGQLLDRKSLRSVTGRTADWPELAKDCVAFANALGGRLLIGIEDGEALPPAEQRIPTALPDTLRRRLGELTVNVPVRPEIPRRRLRDDAGEPGDGTGRPHGRQIERCAVFSRRVGFWTDWPAIRLVRPNSCP